MAHTRTWDEATPQDSSDADLLAQAIRNLKLDIRERMDDLVSTTSSWEKGDPVVISSPSATAQNFSPAGPGIVTLDLSKYRVFQGTVNGATSFVFSNIPSEAITIATLFIFPNPGATITWPPGTVWANVTVPTLQTGVLHLVRLTTVDFGVHWVGEVVQDLG